MRGLASRRPCLLRRCRHKYLNALLLTCFQKYIYSTHINFINMKKLYLLLFSALIFQSFVKAQSQEVYFTSYPTLTPDGKTVIFSYEGDLWKVDINSKAAVRLTAMQGEETNPRVSPDGKWLAFS